LARPEGQQAIPTPIERELRTLVAIVDALTGGEVAGAAGIARRRFEAVELAWSHVGAPRFGEIPLPSRCCHPERARLLKDLQQREAERRNFRA
jgi:hypothetical protein